jgi:SAM-dependent methyltransferase
MKNDSAKLIENRIISLGPTASSVFDQRLKIHTNWQHPGLIFRPMHLSAFDDLVALDPMYLVDTQQTLLTAISDKFTENYQRRVRNYIIDEYSKKIILADLPKNQFGLVTAQNYFVFNPVECINQMVNEVYDLLKPGGAFVFTYNNCDYSGPVKLAENHFACYTPGRLIKQNAAKTGYVLSFEFNQLNGPSILEISKPGQRTSLRGGQTLAVIKDNIQQDNNLPKPNKKSKTPKPIDNNTTKLYTQDEKQQLQLAAIVLEIDTEQNIFANYTAEKLDQLVTNRLNTRDFNHDKFQKRLDKLIQKRKNT